MNLLWLESSIAAVTMGTWVIHDHHECLFSVQARSPFSQRFDRLYNNALAILSRLHILPKSPVKLGLNSTFKTSLRQAITGG